MNPRHGYALHCGTCRRYRRTQSTCILSRYKARPALQVLSFSCPRPTRCAPPVVLLPPAIAPITSHFGAAAVAFVKHPPGWVTGPRTRTRTRTHPTPPARPPATDNCARTTAPRKCAQPFLRSAVLSCVGHRVDSSPCAGSDCSVRDGCDHHLQRRLGGAPAIPPPWPARARQECDPCKARCHRAELMGRVLLHARARVIVFCCAQCCPRH
jgi:hypothetical protein